SFELLATDAKFDRSILLGSKRVSAELADKLFEVPGGVFATMSLDNKPASIVFIGFSVVEVKSLFKSFKETYTAQSSAPTSGRAPAGEDVSTGKSNTGDLQKQSEDWQYTYALGRSFAKCGLGTIEGFNSVTIDPVVSAAKSVKYLVTNTKQWVLNSIDEVRRLKETLSNFDSFASKQWAGWKSKPPEEKSRFYCSFFGGGVGMKSLAMGTEKLVASVATKGTASQARTGTAQTETPIAKKIPLYQKGKAPESLYADARAVVEPNAHYFGKTWYEFPSGGSSAYPYLANRTNLQTLKAMTEKPLPDSAKFDALTDHGWRHSVDTLKNWESTAAKSIDDALASSDIVIDGKSFVMVNGSKFGNSRLAAATDFKPTLAIRNNGLTGQRVFADNGQYRSISSPAIEYQGNGRTGYSTKTPRIQGAEVRIVTESGMIEGRYVSSGGPGFPRGAELTQLSPFQQSDALVHMVQVGDQTILVPAKGAEIFARY
ncbi:MAG: hypothetical protein U1E10_18190, partial [Bdellovibrionales bacterium]|nr:hypothetical protein [Bdellovibrionales bacterium]